MASSQVSLKVGSCSDLHARAGPFDVDVVFQSTVGGLAPLSRFFLTDMIPRTCPFAACRHG